MSNTLKFLSVKCLSAEMKAISITILLWLIQCAHAFGDDKAHLLESVRQRRITATQAENTIYKFGYLDGKTRYFDLGEYHNDKLLQSLPAIDSTIIDVTTLDTSLYSGKFVFWQDVDVSNGVLRPPFAADINHNKRGELYGYGATKDVVPGEAKLVVFELNSAGKFAKVLAFPSRKEGILAQNIVDIDNDGEEELHVYGDDSLRIDSITTGFARKELFYRKTSDTSLATQLLFKYTKDQQSDQRDDPTWGDFDNDGKKDVAYVSFANRFNMMILEYDSDSTYLDSVYSFDPKDVIQGFSVGDFDEDGKTDIVFGSIGGTVYVVECQSRHSYQCVWTGNVSTYNAYMHFWTNDIDGNGKKEFWVGGDAFYANGPPITRFTCFETDGDNQYKAVARIDIVGIFSFDASNCFAKDIDGDGKEEIFICIDQNIFILKFVGSMNHHKYSVLYRKANELANQYGSILGASLSDIDYDGKPELLVTEEILNGSLYYEFTRIYKQAQPLRVIESPHGVSVTPPFDIQIYPNPFNSSTVISYQSPSQKNTTIMIFSLLGKEIRVLVNARREGGEQRVVWDGKDDSGNGVESGIYFVQVSSEATYSVKKLLFIK